MNLVTLDFETYFADDYTLSKMTTEEYVRDSRFKVHCVGIKNENSLDKSAQVVDKISGSGWNKNAFLCHHAHFDGLILSHHYGIYPIFWFDTLSMARLLFPHAKSHSLGGLAKMLGLPEKTVPYESFKNIRNLPPELYNRVAQGCVNDLELTHAIFKKMLPFMPKDELRLIDLTIRMFTEPALKLDRDMLNEYLSRTREEKEDALAALGVTKEDLGSSARFAELLEVCGVEPPTKISKKTQKMAYAFAKTDSALKELLDHDDLRVSALVSARLGVKSNTVETRAQRFLDMDCRGALCAYLKYYGGHPGRWSGGDKANWQNFKRNSVIRESILAPVGYVVVVVDAAQIECRLLDWHAGQEDMLDKFRRKEDIYSEIATEFYQEKVDKTKPDKRGTGKQIVLSCGFGAGADSIKNTALIGTYGPPVLLTDDQAMAARNLYRHRHAKVVEHWRFAQKTVLPTLLNGGCVQWGCCEVRNRRIMLPGSAWIDYTNLRHNGEEYYQLRRQGVSKTYGGKVVQNVTEGLARAVLANAMLQISEKYKIVTCTHDEIVYLARMEEAQEALEFGLAIMKTPLTWCPDIPLDAEGGFDIRYAK